MKKVMIGLVVALALVAGACSQDVTASEEYQSLETEKVALEQKLAYTEDELAVPAEVVAVLDAWWAANDRADGSVVDLYTPTGYHLYGLQRIPRDRLAGHLKSGGSWTHEWITQPYLVAAEPEGRYVVTRGMRHSSSSGSSSIAGALTFEIVTASTGEMQIAQTAWL